MFLVFKYLNYLLRNINIKKITLAFSFFLLLLFIFTLNSHFCNVYKLYNDIKSI